MPLSTLTGNERIKELLRRSAADDRIRQGLIFAGPRGVGKHAFALALAQILNCEQVREGDACGDCIQCRKIARDEHADVRTVSPDGLFIKIGQMREMSREAHFRPFEGRRRVYIIDEADRLREEAANSILKTLEEPPETTLILLITEKPYALLETVRSRCQMLSFGPLAAAELESYIAANLKRPADEVRLLARLARGSIGRALAIDLGEYREKRGLIVELVEALAVSRDTVKLLNLAEYLGRKLDRPAFEDHIDVLLVLLSDLFHLKLGEPAGSLVNCDVAERLGLLSQALTVEWVMETADRVEQVLRQLPRNVNRQLALESALVTA